MGNRELSSSHSDGYAMPGGLVEPRHPIVATVRNVFASVFAVIAVVGTHLGLPLVAVWFVSGLTFTVDGIVLFVIVAGAILLVPIVGTTLILWNIQAMIASSEFSVKEWPWRFAIPSLVGVIILGTASAWVTLDSVLIESFQPLEVLQMNVGAWLMLLIVFILLVTEFRTGMTGTRGSDTESSSSRGNPRESDVIEDRSRDKRSCVETANTVPDDLTFDWRMSPATGFEDVGGMDRVKNELQRRVISPHLANTEAYERFQVSPPNGVLLYGPPGTGKSHLARAIAGELGAPYVELSQADLSSIWINESPSNIRRLFDEAARFKFCVIFIDEFDGLVVDRGTSGHHEDSKVVSEFLARLGTETSNYLVIAATNRRSQIDPAVLRPGRFDEQFELASPTNRERIEIFKVQFRGRMVSLTEADYVRLAEQTAGFTPADIKSVVERAALVAAERDARTITLQDLLSILE